MKRWLLFRYSSRLFLHPAIREFMRRLLCCCCIRAHPPSTQAGRQIKVGSFPPSVFNPFKLSPGVVILTNVGRARTLRSVSSSHRCPGLCPRTAANGSELDQGRTTAVRLPALQLVQHFSLLTQVPPLNLNTC